MMIQKISFNQKIINMNNIKEEGEVLMTTIILITRTDLKIIDSTITGLKEVEALIDLIIKIVIGLTKVIGLIIGIVEVEVEEEVIIHHTKTINVTTKEIIEIEKIIEKLTEEDQTQEKYNNLIDIKIETKIEMTEITITKETPVDMKDKNKMIITITIITIQAITTRIIRK